MAATTIRTSGGGAPSAFDAGLSAFRPNGAIAETTPRYNGRYENGTLLTSGQIFLTAIYLPGNTTVTSITFLSATTALSAGSNQWFGLFDSSRNKLRVTGDDTSTAWSANSAKTLNLSSTFTTTYSGLHYVGICVVATVPSLVAQGASTGAIATLMTNTIAPVLCGLGDGSLTNPASCPNQITALSAAGLHPYAYVS
jgi:hypothetical protein